jgi:hypothetical protein
LLCKKFWFACYCNTFASRFFFWICIHTADMVDHDPCNLCVLTTLVVLSVFGSSYDRIFQICFLFIC